MDNSNNSQNTSSSTGNWQDDDALPAIDRLIRDLGSLGFIQKESRSPKTSFEFSKSYTNPTGRVSRVLLVVKKDAVGLDPGEIDFFVVTTQNHLGPDEQEIKRHAPSFCRDDLLKVLEHFDNPSHRTEVDNEECSLCGISSPEFYLQNKERLCPECAHRRGY